MRRLIAWTSMLVAGLAQAQQPVPATAPAPAAVDCPVCPELALVPPGRFQMGSAPDALERDASTGETPAVPV